MSRTPARFAGACVDACPVGAITVERGGASARGPRPFGVPGHLGRGAAGRCRRGAARDLRARGQGARARAGARLPGGRGARRDPGCVGSGGARARGGRADEVLRAVDERFASSDAEVWARWLAGLAEERLPETMLLGATAFGRELAPRVAVLLQTGLTADCTELDIDPATGLLRQTRPAFGGEPHGDHRMPGAPSADGDGSPGRVPRRGGCRLAGGGVRACGRGTG